MKKSMLLSSILLAAAVFAPASANALDVTKPREVNILFGKYRIPVGKWYCDVGQYVSVEKDEGYAGCDYEACRFLCKWVNDAYLPSSTNIFIDELITPGVADCEENSEYGVTTSIYLAPKYLSKGFDRNQQRRHVVSLVQGEEGFYHGKNETHGTIAFANNGIFTVYALETSLAKKYDDPVDTPEGAGGADGGDDGAGGG